MSLPLWLLQSKKVRESGSRSNRVKRGEERRSNQKKDSFDGNVRMGNVRITSAANPSRKY